MLDGLTTWLLLPLGMALGWALSRRAPELDPMGEATPPPENAELVTDNPELQLSLGTVFRRRGEVDQALALHKALSERTDIAPDQRDAAYLELAEDYQQAASWRAPVLAQGGTVLVKGSRSAGMEAVVQRLTQERTHTEGAR